jgi:hypothetical protein
MAAEANYAREREAARAALERQKLVANNQAQAQVMQEQGPTVSYKGKQVPVSVYRELQESQNFMDGSVGTTGRRRKK